MKIASYNVWNENKGKGNRIDQLRKEILIQNADVIGLQEVTPQFYEKVLSQMGYAHCVYYQYPWEEEGLAVLSRYPLVFSEALYASADCEGSRGMHVVIEVKGMKYSLMNVHLPWDSVKARENQIIAIDLYIHRQQADFYLLMGDFNGGMDSSVDRYLRGDQTLNSHESAPCWNELASAYAARMNETVKPTLDPIHNPRWRGKQAPFAPIVMDRIYVMESWNTVSLESFGLFGTEISEENGLSPSDHYGVVADMEFRK